MMIVEVLKVSCVVCDYVEREFFSNVVMNLVGLNVDKFVEKFIYVDNC